MSRLLEGEKDLTSEYVTDLLKAYEKKEMISQLGIMFPDNQVLKPDGTFVMSSDEISFELLDRQAPFSRISGRTTRIRTGGSYIMPFPLSRREASEGYFLGS